MNASRTVLIVEPSRARRSVLAALLREVGADCVEAATFADGLRRAQQGALHLICADEQLPDGDVETLCRTLRAAPGVGPIPLLVLSSQPRPETFSALRDAGATEVLQRHDVERIRSFLEAQLAPAPHLAGQVLLVEHERNEAETITETLRGLGLEVQHLAESTQALTEVAEHSVDLIVADMLLDSPLGGAGMVRELRAMPGEAGRTPVLIISSQSDPVRRIEALRCGADDFLPKPVIAEELILHVDKLLRGKRLLEDLHAQRARLERFTVTDPLTALHNRRFLNEVAPMYLAEARRHGFPLCVVMMDLDHFERINHTYGDPAGENVLRSVGSLLRRECRREDLAVRVAREEFLLLLSHCALPEAQRKAEGLRQRIAGLNPSGIGVTASLGVAQGIAHEEFGQVLARAGQALAMAQQSGHDRVVVAN